MRFSLSCALALIWTLTGRDAQAADCDLKIAEDASGKKLTSLSITRPFWVILTNKTDHAWTATCLDREN